MTEKRENERITFISTGVVGGKSGEIHCRIENISDDGALICVDTPVLSTLHPGDIVSLKAILLSPVEFQCKITRIDNDRIAVRFIN